MLISPKTGKFENLLRENEPKKNERIHIFLLLLLIFIF